MKEILLLNKKQERKEYYIRVRVTFSFLFIDFHFSHVLGTIKLPFFWGLLENFVWKEEGEQQCVTMVVAMQNGSNINNGVVTLPILSISSPL
jgi:hypothetical protein